MAEFCWFNLAPGESSQFHEFGTNFIRGENRGWILGAKFNICASYDWNHMSADWGKFFVCKWFCRTVYTFTPSLSMLAIQHLYQHLTSILILNDYLGPSSHCDRSGICKTYCLDLLWVYKNSSSLTSPKEIIHHMWYILTRLLCCQLPLLSPNHRSNISWYIFKYLPEDHVWPPVLPRPT